MKLTVLQDRADLVIIDKPSGLLSIPDRFDPTLPSAKGLLEHKYGEKLWVVHRIDRETSGCLVFAKDETTHRHLSLQFQEHVAGKFYVGLVQGRVDPDVGTIDAAIAEHPVVKGKMTTARRGKESRTDYRVVEQWQLHALVQFRIHTGRTHQIRVHLQSIGHPLVCDPLYGDGKPFLLSGIKRKFHLSGKDEEERPLLSRVALHAYRLVVQAPDGAEVSAEAPLPKDLHAAVQQLRKWSS